MKDEIKPATDGSSAKDLSFEELMTKLNDPALLEIAARRAGCPSIIAPRGRPGEPLR